MDFIDRALAGPLAGKKLTKLGWIWTPARACLLVAPEEAQVGARV